jgi:hypothetical protein
MALKRMSATVSNVPWARPSAIVCWYYAIYFCARSLFALMKMPVGEDHQVSARAFASTLRPKLPHPLNMVASHISGQTYRVQLPTCGAVNPYDLSRSFFPTAGIARGMLVQYLGGTCKWFAERKRDQMVRNGEVANFRSKAAREKRDRRLLKEVGFLHCAFRYRVKANYRDAIYLTYGDAMPGLFTPFLSHLAATARFAAIYSLAFAERRLGVKPVRSFARDLTANLQGVEMAESQELFWQHILH